MGEGGDLLRSIALNAAFEPSRWKDVSQFQTLRFPVLKLQGGFHMEGFGGKCLNSRGLTLAVILILLLGQSTSISHSTKAFWTPLGSPVLG